MGGNIFNTNVRINKQQFDHISNDVIMRIGHMTNNVDVIVSYKEKQTFGDIDILAGVDSSNQIFELMNWIIAHLEELSLVSGINKNGNVLSVGWLLNHSETVQIDLIFVENRIYQFAYWYFAYNDMGNFFGKYAHKMGLKFGHKGLLLPYRDSTGKLLDEIEVTTNFYDAVEFLGFDVLKLKIHHQHGFPTMQEVYEFITNHPNFTKEMFSFENMNHTARIRDRKRANYHGLLDYVATLPDNCNKWDPKDQYIEKVINTFPHVAEATFYLNEKERLRTLIASKWNGRVIQRITGLQGKELGNFIKIHRPPDDEIVKMSDDQIEKYIYDKLK